MYKVKFLESGTWYWADRPEAANGTIMTSTHISGYTLNVYQDEVEIHFESGGLAPPFVVNASPVLDGYWSADDIGYTTLLTLTPLTWTVPPAGGTKCLVRIEYTSTLDNVVTLIDATVAPDRRYLSGVVVVEP